MRKATPPAVRLGTDRMCIFAYVHIYMQKNCSLQYSVLGVLLTQYTTPYYSVLRVQYYVLLVVSSSTAATTTTYC
jgi:hypothetical protein